MLLFIVSCFVSPILVFFIFLHLKMRWKYRSLNGIPGPPNYILFGAVLEYGFNSVEKLKNIIRLFKKYGPNYKFQLGPTNMYIGMTDPDLVEFFISSPKFITKSIDYNLFRPWLGNGLLLSTDSIWKKRRKIITPTFHFKILEEFIPIFESPLETLVELLSKNVDRDIFDIYPFITRCTLDIICETAMGTSVNAQSNFDHIYVKSVKRVCNTIIDRGFSPWNQFDTLFKLSPEYKTHMKDIKILHDFTNAIIRKKRIELSKKTEKNEPKQDDMGIKKRTAFLDLLLQAEIDGKPLSDEEINEEVSTFMFEGHDTTSSVIGFTLFELARHPHIQAEAVKELREIFGDNKKLNPTIDDLNNMKYLERVIKEALRLYPPVVFFGRKLEEDVVHENILYPKHLILGFVPYIMHRRPELFENPYEFNPNRFLLENIIKKHPFAYIPFSAGPRNCIGQKFAMYKLKAIVSKILRHFILLPADSKLDPILSAEVILKSANGIHIRLKKR